MSITITPNYAQNYQVDPAAPRLAQAAQSIHVGVALAHKTIPQAYLERSLLATARSMSTSCTGVYTSEIATAIIQKACNESQLFRFVVDIDSYCCHEP